MHSTLDKLQEYYQHIKTLKLTILVSPDIDSICALRVLVALLKSDNVAHEIVPVRGYEDLKEIEFNSQGVVCINLGGIVEIGAMMPDIPVFVMDSHRPLNLDSLYSDRWANVVVFMDPDEPDQEHLKTAFQELEFDSESESEKENEDSDDEQEPKRLKTSQNERIEKKKRKNERKIYQRDIAEYYADGTYYGQPICGYIYELASQMSRHTNDLLWYTITSMTSCFILDRMDQVQYEGHIVKWKTEVERLTIKQDQKKTADDYSISFQEDYRLVLFRHWNLYDSMFNSPYVVARMGLWKENGRTRLTNLIVKLGLGQKDSRQRYDEMDVKAKKNIRENLLEYAGRYNLDHLQLLTFEKNYGYKTSFLASDVVYALLALLDSGVLWLEKHGMSSYEGIVVDENKDENQVSDVGQIGSGVGTRTTTAEIANQVLGLVGSTEEDAREQWIRNFYVAYDALENPSIIQHGILLGIYFQRLIIQKGLDVLENKQVKTLKKFKLLILNGLGFDQLSGETESKLFSQSTALLHRLSGFLMDVYKEHNQKKMPFVICALDQETDRYLVMGRQRLSSGIEKNPFGLAFIEAAQQLGIDASMDSFDSAVVLVPSDDLSSFLDHLLTNTTID
ncbi:CDC45 family [Gorgonomyces haynaldii]|nr:CDC45 family [Gorgonomyces haynaldii]